jgi:alkanesulfonate monooxygenase SsuD/methylene tetrahydromethanopterin reductase-like flavin-dependent oxidoreductase (luciferase family)
MPDAEACPLHEADVLSGGRTAVGIGAGWLADDYKALVAQYDTAPTRIDRLTEASRVITTFFNGRPVTFGGRYYRLDGLEALPQSVQNPRPPVLVGGGGPRMLALAGSLADIAGVHAQLGPGGFDAAALVVSRPRRRRSYACKAEEMCSS